MKALLKVRAKELLQARRAKARLAAGPKSVPSPTAEFREVPGFPGYFVGTDATVWTEWRSRGKKLKSEWWVECTLGVMDRVGHIGAYVHDADGIKRRKGVHVLMLLAFIGPRPAGQLGRHLNDVKTDNRLGNLAWGTPQQNVDDAFRNGRTSNGERHPGAKLTAQDVLLIRQLAAEGEYHDSLATRFGVRQSRITRIVNRKAWRHVA